MSQSTNPTRSFPTTLTAKEFSNSEYISPSTSVFSTIELLTQILEDCAAHDLLCHLPRVNSTFKCIIDNNQSIQKRLFFIPLEVKDEDEDEDEDYYGIVVAKFRINPFLKYLAYRKGAKIEEGCDYNFGPKPPTQWMIESGADLSPNEQWGFDPDDKVKKYLEFDWDKVISDERFLRKEASWKRMLPVQPSWREIWNHSGDSDGREVRPNGQKMLGKTWESVKIRKNNPCCSRLRTFIRSSEWFGVVVMTNVDICTSDTEEFSKIYWENKGYMLSHWPYDEE